MSVHLKPAAAPLAPRDPSAQEQLDFLCKLLLWPQGQLSLDGPNSRGVSGLLEWLLSYAPAAGAVSSDGFSATVYAPTRTAVIAKAMRYYDAQVKAKEMLAEAAK